LITDHPFTAVETLKPTSPLERRILYLHKSFKIIFRNLPLKVSVSLLELEFFIKYEAIEGGAENKGVGNAEVDDVWKAVRIKYSQVSAN